VNEQVLSVCNLSKLGQGMLLLKCCDGNCFTEADDAVRGMEQDCLRLALVLREAISTVY